MSVLNRATLGAALVGLLSLGAASLIGCGRETVSNVNPKLDPPPGEIDAGVVPVLVKQKSDIPLLNVGRATLKVSNIALEKDDGIFTIVKKVEDVEAGVTETISVQFAPQQEKGYENTLRFETNDADAPTVDVKLIGVGSTRATVEVMPSSLEFDRVPECASAVQQLTIQSKGTADLIIEEIGFTTGTFSGYSFVGSTKTPATVKTTGTNGLPGQIQLTVRLTIPAGTMGDVKGGIRLVTTDPDKREVIIPLNAVVNRAPTPTITPFGNAAPGQTVTLDGTSSTDPDGDLPITYKWTLRTKPLSSTTTIMQADQASTTMRLDPSIPGAYEVQLEVTDKTGVKSCQPAKATVVAAPEQKLLIELFWNNAETDLDLHVLRSKTEMAFSAPADCFYQNRNPDWGVVGSTMDDPQLVRDALTGYGPEIFGYINPIDTTYRVLVVFNNDLLSATPDSQATIRIYQYGVLKAEVSKTLKVKDEVWDVADITWPSGDVKLIP